jgi:DNA-directed RNA polymerase beta' subunit
MIKGLYKESYRSGISSISFTDENISPLVWGFSMHVALKDIVALKVSQLHESGILAHNKAREIRLETVESIEVFLKPASKV